MTEIKIENIVYKLNTNKLSAIIVSFDNDAKSIFIPSTVNYKGSTFCVTGIIRGFSVNKNLIESVTFSADSQISILGYNAFCNMQIREITIPDTVTKIHRFAFCWCRSLQKINISPNSNLKKISSMSFVDTSITSLYIPSNLTDLQPGWCDRASKLQEIIVSPQNKNFIFYQNKFLLGKSGENKDDLYDILLFSRRDIEHCLIPSTIKRIGSYAFNHCLEIKTFKFESNSKLKSLENHAFRESNIKRIVIPSTVEIIDAECFFDSTLQKVEFEPNSKLKIIGVNAFSYSYLHDVNLPPSLTRINGCPFTNCNNLKSLKFEYSENSEKCFVDSNLVLFSPVNHLVFPANYVSFGNCAINMCNQLMLIEFLGDDLTFLQDNFKNCPKLIAVSFPNANKVTLYNKGIDDSNKCSYFFKPYANVVIKTDDQY